MSRILITGSTDGLGKAAAARLLDEGHRVVVHARDEERTAAVADLAARGADVVVADLASLEQVRRLAADVNRIGRMDVVIHNAGVAHDAAALMPVNVVAPYVLTARLERPRRLIYLGSSMHLSGTGDLDGDFSGRMTYPESKLLLTALSNYVADAWPEVITNVVCPGWMPTKMGGPGAPGDLNDGIATQVWLATSDDPEALGTGRYWQHMTLQEPHPLTRDAAFQRRLVDALARETGERLTPSVE